VASPSSPSSLTRASPYEPKGILLGWNPSKIRITVTHFPFFEALRLEVPGIDTPTDDDEVDRPLVLISHFGTRCRRACDPSKQIPPVTRAVYELSFRGRAGLQVRI